MSYYREIRQANKTIDNTIYALKTGEGISTAKIILAVTAKHAVSISACKKRINLLLEADPTFTLNDGVLTRG